MIFFTTTKLLLNQYTKQFWINLAKDIESHIRDKKALA